MTENEKSRPEIYFKPKNKGLGFHPFSDGLPYAPITPAPSRPVNAPLPPSGAVAASPVARPVMNPPRVQFAPKAPTVPRVDRPVKALRTPTVKKTLNPKHPKKLP